ncbi:SRPBCC family protein [Mycobacterium sp. NPDC050441]|uniref:type II toxin-antitoxin system Rv0910 family toxin n=1 Tax=Mycobacterium sp. NPDC050441 TaxID=3155403 RepID=UPI0033E3F09E
MARTTASREIVAPPEKVWAVLADPRRNAEWNTLHTQWKDEPPAQLAAGAQMTAVLTIMGMANTITQTVDQYDPPNSFSVSGTGMAGAKVSLTTTVEPRGEASLVTIDAEFISQMMVGAIGGAIERASRKELEASLDKLAGLVS